MSFSVWDHIQHQRTSMYSATKIGVGKTDGHGWVIIKGIDALRSVSLALCTAWCPGNLDGMNKYPLHLFPKLSTLWLPYYNKSTPWASPHHDKWCWPVLHERPQRHWHGPLCCYQKISLSQLTESGWLKLMIIHLIAISLDRNACQPPISTRHLQVLRYRCQWILHWCAIRSQCSSQVDWFCCTQNSMQPFHPAMRD